MFACACRSVRRVQLHCAQNISKVLASDYKSKKTSSVVMNPWSLRCSKLALAWPSRPASSDESFTGVIPLEKLDIQYSRSSGPGGQHVNKVNTKVEVRFNIDEADWIPAFAKPVLKEQQTGKISKDGYLIVKSEKTRKQILNQADCLDKVRHMIFQACQKPKELSEEEKQKIEKRKAKANAVRIKQKRMRSFTKQSRMREL